jgi:V8-like Glu-specific endopeptidase
MSATGTVARRLVRVLAAASLATATALSGLPTSGAAPLAGGKVEASSVTPKDVTPNGGAPQAGPQAPISAPAELDLAATGPGDAPPPALTTADTPPVSDGSFGDVPARSVHRATIARLVGEGITRGCGDGTNYCPSDAVSRAQMASFIVRAMEVAGFPVPDGTGSSFPDIRGNTHETPIRQLAEAEVVRGGGDGLYHPRDPVSRGQMALFVQRAFELPAGPDARFVDVGPAHREAVNAIAGAAITQGCTSDGTRYCPADPVRRDQMASFIVRTLEVLDVPMPPGGDTEAPAIPDLGREGEEPTDPSATGEGDTDAELPDEDRDDVIIHPAVTGGAGGDPAGQIPPPVNIDRSPFSPDVPTMEELRAEGSGDVGGFLYRGHPVFGYRSASFLNYGQLPYTVGLLEMWHGNQFAGTCSGTVVSRDLVLTAAHCLYSIPSQQFPFGRENTCFRFYPDRYGNSASVGAWESCTYYRPSSWNPPTWSDWMLAFDYALVRMSPNARGRIGDVVGTYPVLMDAAQVNARKYSIGYPVEGWFAPHSNTTNGYYPWHCTADDPGNPGRTHWGNGWYSMGYGCDMNGGNSGGPVFGFWNGRWWVTSVVSTGGYVVPCPHACFSNRNSWYMRNGWGPDLRGVDYGFRGLWNFAHR